MHKVKTELKALPNEKVVVENYRRKPAVWEAGVVTTVETSWNSNGVPWNSYTVTLDRRTAGGYPIRVTVTDTGVRRRE